MVVCCGVFVLLVEEIGKLPGSEAEEELLADKFSKWRQWLL